MFVSSQEYLRSERVRASPYKFSKPVKASMLARADVTGNSLQIEQWWNLHRRRNGKLGKMKTQEFLLSSLYFDILSENREERTLTGDIF